MAMRSTRNEWWTMRATVLQAWHRFSEPLEGRVSSMYLDIIGLVTTGVGNLIDASRSGGPNPWTPALELPWKHAYGRPATHGEIRDAWLALKARQDLAKMHWKYAAKLNDLRLSDADIDALVEKVLHKNEKALKKAFPGWDNWPADAQLGALSMSWAVGTGFPGIFKNFTAYANKGDWVAASVACKIRTTATSHARKPDGTIVEIHVPNPGTIPRNRANELCFMNAAIVTENGLDPETLFWPLVATPDVPKQPEPRNSDYAPDTDRVVGLVADTMRQSYEDSEEERRKARDADVRDDTRDTDFPKTLDSRRGGDEGNT